MKPFQLKYLPSTKLIDVRAKWSDEARNKPVWTALRKLGVNIAWLRSDKRLQLIFDCRKAPISIDELVPVLIVKCNPIDALGLEKRLLNRRGPVYEFLFNPEGNK